MKNDALSAIVAKLQADIPEVTWTRRALFEHEVTQWPTGCVVATEWRARGEPGAPRIWDGTIVALVYATHSGDANEDMVTLLDRVEASLDNTEIDGAALLQLASARIDQDDLQTGLCKLEVTLTLTI